jgi:hypothetical protein
MWFKSSGTPVVLPFGTSCKMEILEAPLLCEPGTQWQYGSGESSLVSLGHAHIFIAGDRHRLARRVY